MASHEQIQPPRIESTFLSRLAAREQAFGIVPADQLRTPEDRMLQYDRLEKWLVIHH